MVKKRPQRKRNGDARQRRSSAGSSTDASGNSSFVGGLLKLIFVLFCCAAILYYPYLQDDTLLAQGLIATNSAGTAFLQQTPTIKKKEKRRHPQFNESWTIFQRIEAEQTGRVLTSPPRDMRPLQVIMAQRKVEFMVFHRDVSKREANSGSWLQRKSDFLTMQLEKMQTWEDASLFAYHDADADNRAHLLNMPLDILDFNVEHLVAWWEILKVYENDIPFQAATSKLENYIKQPARDSSGENKSLMKETIAVVVFSEYTGRDPQVKEVALLPPVDKRDQLNKLALAATLESLRRIGFGRAVVVVSDLGGRDETLAKTAFAYLVDAKGGDANKVGEMQVGYVKSGLFIGGGEGDPLPKSALMGLREAFQASKEFRSGDASANDPSRDRVNAWIGAQQSADYWKYVYMTEHGSILNHRALSLQKIKDKIDAGGAMLPHRLQPIPHASDVGGARRTDTYLPKKGAFDTVLDIDTNEDTCCDDKDDGDRGPGLPPKFPSCGDKLWFQCGFGDNPEEVKQATPNQHERLEQYKLMRLKTGTGITLVAGTAQGRRCSPVERGSGCKFIS